MGAPGEGTLQDGGDIPETVTQASGAASKAMELLAPARNSLITICHYQHDSHGREASNHLLAADRLNRVEPRGTQGRNHPGNQPHRNEDGAGHQDR